MSQSRTIKRLATRWHPHIRSVERLFASINISYYSVNTSVFVVEWTLMQEARIKFTSFALKLQCTFFFRDKMWREQLTLTNSKCCVNAQVHVPLSSICSAVHDQCRVVWPHSKPHVRSNAKYLIDHICQYRCQRQEPSNGLEVMRVNVPFHLQRKKLI